MADSDDDQFCWRDTYFVWFDSTRRPTLRAMDDCLRDLPDQYVLQAEEDDGAGRFESITLRSPGDHVMLEISYLDGPDILEQAQTTAEEMRMSDDADQRRIAALAACNARFDILQFEQIENAGDDPDEAFDPSTLLIVMTALTKLVDGIGVDPQSGLIC